MAVQLSSQFTQFVQFAQRQMDAGNTKAIARDNVCEAPLGGRKITAASGDKVAPFFGRSEANKDANNVARSLFRQAIRDMFGGENNIPRSVKDAMLLKDYDKGKPLTARRIMAVTRAIVNESEELAQQLKLAQAKDAALSDGYSMAEVEKMDRVAGFYAEVAGCTAPEAFKEVSTPGTKANRLMNYGGRFTENVQNFRDGLRLLDTFTGWFNGVADGLKAIGGAFGKRTDDMNKTMLNADTAIFRADNLRSVEKFVFEHLAHDASADLSETDGERMFGFENNPAARFFGLGLNSACTQTVSQIPPEKRGTFYAAVNMFYPLADSAAVANTSLHDRNELTHSSDNTHVVARVLRNFDKIAEMEAQGTLTLKNLVRLCFPELPQDSACEIADVAKLVDDFGNAAMKALEAKGKPQMLFIQVLNTMTETGCTIDEAVEAATGGKRPQTPKYVSGGTLELSAFDGTTAAGRNQVIADLVRPRNYVDMKTQKSLLAPDDMAFKFRFPGEDEIATNGMEHGKANIPTVLDRIERLCGKAHPVQASSVMTMVTQSGLGILNAGLSAYGIDSNEHCAVDFTLTKDADTGDVTIRYSSPKSLPFSFEWTATVRPDGYVSTTPFQFHDAKQNGNAAIEP